MDSLRDKVLAVGLPRTQVGCKLLTTLSRWVFLALGSVPIHINAKLN